MSCAVQLKLEIRPKARAAVSKVLLVGGSTRMPAVKRFLTNMTGLTPEDNDAVDPDEAVALGAAVQVCETMLARAVRGGLGWGSDVCLQLSLARWHLLNVGRRAGLCACHGATCLRQNVASNGCSNGYISS
jgi:hypothetical protein